MIQNQKKTPSYKAFLICPWKQRMDFLRLLELVNYTNMSQTKYQQIFSEQDWFAKYEVPRGVKVNNDVIWKSLPQRIITNMKTITCTNQV